jgi:hypothetical protein
MKGVPSSFRHWRRCAARRHQRLHLVHEVISLTLSRKVSDQLAQAFICAHDW